jgi:hypothetical protein
MSHKTLPPISFQSSYYPIQRAARHSYRDTSPSYRASVQSSLSLDVTQRIERKIAEYDASQNMFKRCLFETISLTTSVACMVITNLIIYQNYKSLANMKKLQGATIRILIHSRD